VAPYARTPRSAFASASASDSGPAAGSEAGPWLAADPLWAGARWAWQAFAISGGAGFLSFLAYLGSARAIPPRPVRPRPFGPRADNI
jgi:hypothetical protein